jgi:DNA replicative helicase MCM subunit Mcm2 (Cdc46/Mcm family)
VYVYRVKDCPQGSPELDWAQEILNFQQVVQFARNVKHVSMSKAARQWWNDSYSKFEHEGPEGLAGKMTTRAAAHIRRIAMLYALIDLTDQIELEHFQAAEKLWRYCEDSASFIFGGATREQLRIVKWIEQRGSATFNQLRDELYHRHRLVNDIRADLDQLVKAGKLAVKNGVYVTSQNVGKLAA